MMRDVLLSVIIPVYNTEKYVNQCVNSVIDQGMENLEIILVDDGSTDSSGLICDSLSKQYDCICVIHKINEGLGSARNTGILKAKGKYLAFLDSDDYVEPGFYGKLVSSCELTNADICFANGIIKYTPSKKKTEFFVGITDSLICGEKVKNSIPRLIATKLGKTDLLPCSACLCVINRVFLISNSIEFVSERKLISEDLWFCMDCFSCALCISYAQTIGYNYRYNEGSLSRKYAPNRFSKIVFFVEQLEIKCKKMGLEDYLERIALLFWSNFEKCINQEIRYKRGFAGKNNIQYMTEHPTSEQYLTMLYTDRRFRGLHGILCHLLYNGHYVVSIILLKLYNLLVHGD